jgi:GNAT superfamily N-acetyltransferase
MKLLEVKNDKKLAKEFMQLPMRLYKNEKNWIRPIDKEVAAVFDPNENPYFNHGKCTRWILQDNAGITIGRVAAFVNEQTADKGNKQPTGGMGFFECINDQAAAFKLFDVCKEWNQAQGMEAMDGPINFGNREKFWGLLTEGYIPQNYGMNYHFPYYKDFFEAYGFQDYFQQFTFGREIGSEAEFPTRLVKLADRILTQDDYEVRPLEKKKLDKYTEDLREIYNQAWANHSGVDKMDKARAKATVAQLKDVLDPDLIMFAYHNGRPIGMFIMIPELNHIFKHVNGKLNLLGKLKFVYHKLRGTCDTALGLVFGVIPDYQSKGVETALAVAWGRHAGWQPNYKYKDIELNWIGDFNTTMVKMCRLFGFKIRKKHTTYRLLFDENAVFERAPVMK